MPSSPTEPSSAQNVAAASCGSSSHDSTTASVDHRLHELSQLLEFLEPVSTGHEAPTTSADDAGGKYENRLAQVRLGMAGSLFTALRCKNAATAAHSVRVALGCSAWALAMEFPEAQRDAIEVAALLHDIGKIGVPDRLLLKPGALTPEEHATDGSASADGVGYFGIVLCLAAVLEIVRHAPTWFDGS